MEVGSTMPGSLRVDAVYFWPVAVTVAVKLFAVTLASQCLFGPPIRIELMTYSLRVNRLR